MQREHENLAICNRNRFDPAIMTFEVVSNSRQITIFRRSRALLQILRDLLSSLKIDAEFLSNQSSFKAKKLKMKHTRRELFDHEND